MRPMRECECGALFRPTDDAHKFCSNHCARIAQARHGGASPRDKDARFIDEVMAAHHRIWPEDEMSKSKPGLSYLERHAAKHKTPPDDHRLSQADKGVVKDEAEAEARAKALRDQEIAKARDVGLAEEALRKRLAAAERAYDDAKKEETAPAAERTFFQRLKDYLGGA